MQRYITIAESFRKVQSGNRPDSIAGYDRGMMSEKS